MNDFGLPEHFFDRIFEIKNENNSSIKLVSYFPFTSNEKEEIQKLTGLSIFFHSIFSDSVSNEEWELSKSQIKKRFQDELFEID
jgi:hypothetical protein